MIRKCIACHREDDLINLAATHEWIHFECIPWWQRRRDLGPFLWGLKVERAFRYVTIGLGSLAVLMLIAGCGPWTDTGTLAERCAQFCDWIVAAKHDRTVRSVVVDATAETCVCTKMGDVR